MPQRTLHLTRRKTLVFALIALALGTTLALAAVEYREFPLMRTSALSHLLEMTYNEVEAHVAHSHEVSKRLLLEMAHLAMQHHVTLVVAGIMDDELTHELLTFAHNQGIPALELADDLTTDAYWNVPHDGGHPSPLANRLYAARLEALLRHEVLTDEFSHHRS
jgi:hypothetical protein